MCQEKRYVLNLLDEIAGVLLILRSHIAYNFTLFVKSMVNCLMIGRSGLGSNIGTIAKGGFLRGTENHFFSTLSCDVMHTFASYRFLPPALCLLLVDLPSP